MAVCSALKHQRGAESARLEPSGKPEGGAHARPHRHARKAHPSPGVHLSHDSCRVVSLREGRGAAYISGSHLSSNSKCDV